MAEVEGLGYAQEQAGKATTANGRLGLHQHQILRGNEAAKGAKS